MKITLVYEPYSFSTEIIKSGHSIYVNLQRVESLDHNWSLCDVTGQNLTLQFRI